MNKNVTLIITLTTGATFTIDNVPFFQTMDVGLFFFHLFGGASNGGLFAQMEIINGE